MALLAIVSEVVGLQVAVSSLLLEQTVIKKVEGAMPFAVAS
tara:strand:+ start:9821 stop:9943 length:123 start_codon:yes stop_codon:yes gene_type:complete